MLLTITPDNSTQYKYIRTVNATYGSEAVQCLERVYQRARELTPDLPANVSFTIKQSGRKGRSIVLGHFLRGAFDNGTACAPQDAVHEINISGDCLSRGPLQVLQTVLHEAVHALCAVRGIKETTRQNRYHNKKFVQIAEELSLTYDDPQNYRMTINKQGEEVLKLVPDVTIGFSNVCITDETRELYRKNLTCSCQIYQSTRVAPSPLVLPHEHSLRSLLSFHRRHQRATNTRYEYSVLRSTRTKWTS